MPTPAPSLAAALACVALCPAAAHAADFALAADPGDFELRQEQRPSLPDFLRVTTQSFVTQTLDVWKDGDSEYRAVVEFNLAPALAAGGTVASAELVMERVFSIYPDSSVRVNGLTTNRAAPLGGDNAAAVAAWDTPDAVVLSDAFAPNAAPDPADEVFTLDVTAHLQARLYDARATPGSTFVAFRLDPFDRGTDLRFTSADAAEGFRPALRLTVVPEPATATLTATGGLVVLLRRRRL